ncbi:hypothetical protein M877_08715 [Streptomyces niveus NCIMB 11891]|nr:hypothetical protein M877_08715 [Streptomyces niveus NCIMB 11891]
MFAPTVGVVDEAVSLAQVHEQGDRGVRDHGDVDGCREALDEAGHADAGRSL